MLMEAEAGRWTAMLATLLQNRVPMVQSLSLARDSLLLESFKAQLAQVERAVRGGSGPGAALADYRIFDESLVNLINVGERCGRLADMLKSAAHLAEQKGRDRIKRLMALLEPVSILVIGCMIGVIVISLFTAITSINNVPLCSKGRLAWGKPLTIPGRLLTALFRRKEGQHQTENGFTLLELLVVLAIIGLLGALIGPRLFERLEGSKVVTAQTQVRMLKTALDTMRLDIGRYPSAEEGLDLLVRAPTDPQLRLRWHGPYLEGELPLDPWGSPYQYGPTRPDLNAITLYSFGPTGRPGPNPARYLPPA